MAAIVGAAGLPSTLSAARAGKDVLLANKEALVMSGPLFMRAVAEGGGALLPIDSEHSAVFQSLPRGFACGREGELARAGVRRIVLTASGGPFRRTPVERLARVTPEQAVAHPNWVMGPKISVDSATMMNKGLEVIEAHWLFGAPLELIHVVVHPQSVIHSMVEYHDGSVIAQLGTPDMRTPIACALAWPERIEAGVAPLDFTTCGPLEFERLDPVRFPCMRLAAEAIRRGGTAPAALNAANEIAVEAFLAGRLSFTGIPEVIERVLAETSIEPLRSLDQVYAVDIESRGLAARFISRLAPRASSLAS
jgi:1-deoxy-D-xylulose-5-phosphate reductoisomerase